MLALFVAASVPALVSCSSTGEDVLGEVKPSESPTEMPIGFSVGLFSRAVDLSTVHDNFCVRALKVDAEGAKSLVMPDYFVKSVDGKWIYNGQTGLDGSTQYLKYWDLSASSYTFAAVTPASAEGSACLIDDNGMVTITLADLATNWMIARTIRLGVNDASVLIDFDDIGESINDIDKSAGKTSAVFPTPNAPYADVPLNFHSILAKVVIKAYADGEIALNPLEVGLNNIGIAPATYTSATGWATTHLDYQLLYNQNTLITDEQNSRETALQLTELFVIPQQETDATNSSLVQIKVKTDNNDDRVRYFNIPSLWEPNKTYTYYLKFESGETGEIILVDVMVEPLIKGGEAEKEQTNW